MGLFSKAKNWASKAGKTLLSKDAVKGFLISGGGVLPGIGEGYAGSDEIRGPVNEILKGAGNMISGGYITQKEANEEAQKMRNQARDQYAAAEAAAEAEAARIANLEEERKRRLASYGTGNPQTLLNSYLGVTGQASVSRATLG